VNRDLIGVGTSVSKDKNWDPLDTLQFARENNTKIVQIYLNDDLIAHPGLINDAREYAEENDMLLTCHSPEPLNKKALSKKNIAAANELLMHQAEKRIVIHYDEKEKLDDCLMCIEELYENELIVCLENYYVQKETKNFARNINIFNSIFTLAMQEELPVYPVIDFPRLFISGIIENVNSLLITKQILDNLSMLSMKVILHLIDFTDYGQQRNSWCAIGKGLMPYKEIFEFIHEIELDIDHCILEYEDKKLYLESLTAVRSLVLNNNYQK
jgi:hypothetical protein